MSLRFTSFSVLSRKTKVQTSIPSCLEYYNSSSTNYPPPCLPSLIHPSTATIFLKCRYCYVTLLLRKLMLYYCLLDANEILLPGRRSPIILGHTASEALFPTFCPYFASVTLVNSLPSQHTRLPKKSMFYKYDDLFQNGPLPLHLSNHWHSGKPNLNSTNSNSSNTSWCSLIFWIPITFIIRISWLLNLSLKGC